MNREEFASKCHDIQVSLDGKEVPDFELIPKVGMMVNLALHIRGLSTIEYDILRMVSSHYFDIPTLVFKDIITSLAEIEFVSLYSQKGTIKTVTPTVPYFDSVYDRVGEFAETSGFSEPETAALIILEKLSQAPTEKSNIYTIGAEKKIIDRNVQIGVEGGYILKERARGKDILISPLFFSENYQLFADLAAKSGAKTVQRILGLIKESQGWPLSVIEQTKMINGKSVSADEINLIKRLAHDSIIKPPAITTPHAGQNYFLFPPTPGNAKLNLSNKEIYERAMALIASVRQGQLLAQKYPIRNPLWILNSLKSTGYLRPTTETQAQYQQLAIMRVGRIEPTGGSWHKFVLIDTEENVRALNLAISLLSTGSIANMEIDQEARIALQKDQTYIESILSSSKLRKDGKIELDEETKEEIDNLLLKASA
jgi:hypothetical protein